MDVIRDRSIVQLNQNQVRVLETNLQATRDRFEVGDLTRTDVAQSDARLALAREQPRHRAGPAAGERGELPARDRRRIPATCAAAARCRRLPAHRRPGGRHRARQQCRPRLDRRPGPRRRLDVSVARAGAAADRLREQPRPAIPIISAPPAGGNSAAGALEQHGHRPASACRAHAALPGRPRRRAGPPGAVDPRPAARAGRGDRALGRRQHPRRLRLLPGRAAGDRSRTRSRSRPTRSRSKARAPSRRSAPATCSTCSTPSRNC